MRRRCSGERIPVSNGNVLVVVRGCVRRCTDIVWPVAKHRRRHKYRHATTRQPFSSRIYLRACGRFPNTNAVGNIDHELV